MYIGKVKYGDNTWPVGSTLYGTCDTAAGTAAKVVTMPDFDTLLEGVTIHVKFTHSNGAHLGNATLNVNNTGAKTIMRYGTTAAGVGASASWNAGAVVSFTYDGTYWLMNDWVNTDTNTTYTLSTGDSNGQIKVTPSSGSAYNVSVKGLGDRAFDSTSYLPIAGNSTSLSMTGTIYMKDVNGIILNSNNNDLNIWEVYGNAGAWASQYGFNLQYKGTSGSNDNDLILWAHNQTSTHKEVYRVHQNGLFIFKLNPYVNNNTIYHDNYHPKADQLTTSRTIWGLSFDGTADVSGYMSGVSAIEFTGLGSSSGHGGYLDFHYNGSTADYTSRLIEESSGNLVVYGNNLKVNGYPVFHSNHVLLSNGEDIVDDYGIGIVGCHGMLPANLVSDFASGNANYNTPTGISPYNWGQVLNFFYHQDNCHFLLYVSDASSNIDMNSRNTGMFYRSGWSTSSNPYYSRRPWRLILDNASILTYYGLMLDQTSTHSILKMAYPKTSNFYNVLRYGGANANGSDLLVGSDSKDTHIVGRDIYVDAGNYSNCIFVNNNGGNVGIGTTSPSYKLHVNGACAASSFPNTSDIRLKDVYSDWSPNIEDIAYAPSFLFKWKDGKDKNMHAGTSAQYWLSKAPELVTEAKDDIGTLSIQYDVLGTLSSITLAKEILELKKEIKRLQALIAEIKLLQK